MDELEKKASECLRKAEKSRLNCIAILEDWALRTMLYSDEYKEFNKIFNEVAYGRNEGYKSRS